MDWYVKAIKNYVNFSGRARRKEYWMFFLINDIIIISLIGVMIILWESAKNDAVNAAAFSGGANSVAVLLGLYTLFILLPNIAVTVRRLHDQGMSGAYFFVRFIPLYIGAIWNLVLMCTEGTRGPNQYGDDPKTEISSGKEVIF